MQCAGCGFDNAANAKFCGECAAPLARVCPACGFANPPAHKFCGECATPLAPPASAPASERAASPAPAKQSPGPNPERPTVRSQAQHGRVRVQAPADAPLEGERKTVTALFADVKGSMELIEDLDPEEARAIVDPALTLMIDAVRRYDGYIVQSTGDGIFALFGAPVAHEDHPQRALYAALRLQEEMHRYSARLRETGNLPIEARVGVNTGEVVVRPIRTADAHVEYTPIGHSTSLAARMQALAPTGSIATTDQTRRLCEGYFAFKPLGPTRVKGVSEPVNVYELVGPGVLRTRLQVSMQRGLSRFVGRQAEMDAIKRALEASIAGRGQIVAAVGEAGMGKSRLVHEFKAIARTGCLILEAFSVSHGRASAYLPLIDLLKNYFQFSPDDDPRRRREKIAGKVLVLDRALEGTLPYLYGLIGVAEGDDPLAQMDSQIRQQRTLAGIKSILLRESLNQPLIVVFEDLHWIDAGTQAFLSMLADGIGNARVLLLVNYRPEYRHEWGNKTYYTQLRLDPLGMESADEMLSALLASPAPATRPPGVSGLARSVTAEDVERAARETGEGSSLEALKRFIIAKTEGNPFFMEEMVQALFEEGVLVRNGAVKLLRPATAIRVSPTVQGILASRIDRLPPREKELLQTLAIIGREFPLGLIEKTAAIPAAELRAMLSNLQLAEFIYEQPAFAEVEYIFKHALTQEVAYNSALIERRKTLHERIASAIEEQFAGRLDDHFGELARHYGRSGNSSKGIDYLWLAANQATQRSLYAEAIDYVTTALELLAGMPDGPQRAQDELRLRVTQGVALMAAKGFSSDETEQAYARARELARGMSANPLLFAALQGMWAFHYTRGNVKPGLEIAQELMAQANQLNDTFTAKTALFSIGSSLELAGDLAGARRHLEQAVALPYSPASEGGPQRYGPDPNVLCLTRLSSVLLDLGYPDQALKMANDAIAAIDAKSDPFSLAMAIMSGTQIRCARREPAKGEELARSLIALCEERGYPFWLSVGKRMLAWAMIQQGHAKEGTELIERVSRQIPVAEADMARFQSMLILAEGYLMTGAREQAGAVLDQWRAVRDKLGITVNNCCFYDLRGKLHLDAGDYQAAEEDFRAAIDVATRRGARQHELRSALDLARLLKTMGRREAARQALSEVYGWFTEGFETPDLIEAKALLEELGA